MSNRIAGVINIAQNGVALDAVGNFTLNLGQPKREDMVGADRWHGYKEMPQAAGGSGEIRDRSDLDVINTILNMTNATITIEAANGKTYLFEEAFYKADGSIETEDGKIQFEWGARSGQELLA